MSSLIQLQGKNLQVSGTSSRNWRLVLPMYCVFFSAYEFPLYNLTILAEDVYWASLCDSGRCSVLCPAGGPHKRAQLMWKVLLR